MSWLTFNSFQVNTEFRDELNKFRDYTRALGNYKRQLQKIQQEQRKAEWEARKKEAENPIDADLPSDDPLVGHPWADEILQCKDLEKVLATFLPKEAKAEVKEEEKEKTWLKGAAGKMAGKEEADPFAELAVSKKSKGSKKSAAPAAARIVLSMDTISSLSTIGISIPTTAADVQGCIDKVVCACEAIQLFCSSFFLHSLFCSSFFLHSSHLLPIP